MNSPSMAVRSLLTGLKRAKFELYGKNHLWRQICSFYHGSPPVNGVGERAVSELAREILRLKHSAGCVSVTTAIQSRTDKGIKVSLHELRRLSINLLRSRRYNHSLQIMDWLESQSKFRMSPDDYAIKTELIAEVKGLTEAEEYYKNLSGSASLKAASFPLLRAYLKQRENSKAEAFMAKLNRSGLIVNAHPCNLMMKLYTATSEFKKVGLVVAEMKRNRIPLNVLSYNLWMNASLEISGVKGVEMAHKEMVSDRNVEVGWSSLSTLANAYAKSGLTEKANNALGLAEKKLSKNGRLAFSFLMTQHASLGNKDKVLQLWESSKGIGGRVTCANYMSAILCFVKMGDLEKAEGLFGEWEISCGKYDVRVSNVLLGAYARNNLMGKAEALHLRTLERGGSPNYKTWEILAEGWVRSRDMEKAIDAVNRACSMLKNCHWRPSKDVVMAVADYYEEQKNFVAANKFISTARDFGFASLPLYKSLLRIHRSSLRPAYEILEMMEKDEIEVDEEAHALIQAANGSCAQK